MISISSSLKRVVGSLVLVAFLALALLSLNVMMRGPDGRMEGNCPFSATGASLCSQDTLASVAHHISAYESSLNVPVGTGLTALLFLLIAFGAALFFSIFPLLSRILAPTRYFYRRSLPVSFRARKIARWLSLFENSPSFA